jgi:CCR4-NOT transcription complex subunit 7/8
MRATDPAVVICDVWADNLDHELEKITQIIEDYPYVSMDTEFPGVVARPVGTFRNVTDYNYQTMRCNVDLLKMIQLGLTFSDNNGNLPPECSTWQFNFKMSLTEDMYAQDSIDLLTRSGIDFNNNEVNGIDMRTFGEKLTTSGIVLSDELIWVSFHSGYDFGYLVKLLTAEPMPERERDFYELMNIFFPIVYDVKHLAMSNRQCQHLRGGLNTMAETLHLERVGPSHQAGSDSLLTAATFFQLRNDFFPDGIDPSTRGVLYNLGLGVPASDDQQAGVPGQ